MWTSKSSLSARVHISFHDRTDFRGIESPCTDLYTPVWAGEGREAFAYRDLRKCGCKISLLGARDMSGIVAHNLSGLRCHREVTDETDRMATGDSEDAI